ncbi:MAG TPA: hypothetical protein VEL07_16395 [Planctomycetota bacterium]|nr:hypothetical protein [Planctomycetota bacterium]
MPDEPETLDAPPNAPDLPEHLPLSLSLVVCERAYQAQNGLWVPAGTFNYLITKVKELNLDASGWVLPSLAIYYRLQWDREKTFQLLFVYRIVSVNGHPRNSAQSVARADFSLTTASKFFADGGIQIPAVAIATSKGEAQSGQKDHEVVFQVEAWGNGKLLAYQLVTLKHEVAGNQKAKT